MRTLRSVVRSSDLGCLLSGFCSSGRGFAPRFLQTPPRGDALALRSHFTSIRLCRGLAPPGCRTCSAHDVPVPGREDSDRSVPIPPGGCPAMTKATIRVPGLKVTVPLSAQVLPRDLVPMEGPADDPAIDLVLDGGLTARARINGKSYRKMLKQIAEHGA